MSRAVTTVVVGDEGTGLDGPQVAGGGFEHGRTPVLFLADGDGEDVEGVRDTGRPLSTA